MVPPQIKRLIGSEKGSLSILERFVAGSLAGVIAQSTIYPMEVIILFSAASRKAARFKLLLFAITSFFTFFVVLRF